MKNITFFYVLIFILASLSSCKKEKTEIESDEIAVGQQYQGGIIFYIDGSGQHGLIAAETNQTNAICWYNGNYIFIDSTETAVGKGYKNTSNIISAQNPGAYAASICEQLTLNGYSDWFLPSKNELNLLYQRMNQIGGFTEGYYWSSTEYDSLNSWNQYFPFGPQYYADKSDSACVRAIRAF